MSIKYCMESVNCVKSSCSKEKQDFSASSRVDIAKCFMRVTSYAMNVSHLATVFPLIKAYTCLFLIIHSAQKRSYAFAALIVRLNAFLGTCNTHVVVAS